MPLARFAGGLLWSLVAPLIEGPSVLIVQGTSHRHLSDHLSDLIETTLDDLAASKVRPLTAAQTHGTAGNGISSTTHCACGS